MPFQRYLLFNVLSLKNLPEELFYCISLRNKNNVFFRVQLLKVFENIFSLKFCIFPISDDLPSYFYSKWKKEFDKISSTHE